MRHGLTFPNMILHEMSQVFNSFRSLPPVHQLDLKTLSKKLCMLLILLSGGQRCQTVHAIDITDLQVVGNTLVIPIMSKIKQTRPSKHMAPLKFTGYPTDPKLCVLTHMGAYLQRTKQLCQCASLFVSYIKPHSAVGKETLSRWCKNVLKDSGIDINKYSSYSSRSAASSKAKLNGMSLRHIVASAGWSQEATFAKYYDKPIDNARSVEQYLL